jgi:NitT/TauT family transport system substrate-binding protein
MGRIVRVALAAFLVCAAAAAAGAQTDTVRLAIGYIPHVQFTPLYVGIDKGFYREEGIDLQLSFGFQYDVFSLLAAGKIDVGLSDADQLVQSGSKGMGLEAIFQYYQGYPIAIVAKAGAVTAPSDLKGRTIGTPDLYGSSWIGLQLFLRKYGLQGSVRVQKIGYTQEATLMSGRADAVVCFFNNEPIVFRARGVALKEWNVKDFSAMVGPSFISSRGIAAARTAVLTRFARATRRAMAYTVEHRQEAAAIAMKNVGNVTKEEEPLFRQRLDATCALFGGPSEYGVMDVARYQRSIDELVGLGVITASYPAASIVRQF